MIEKSIKNFIYYLEFEENKKHNTVISIRKDLNQFLIYLNDYEIYVNLFQIVGILSFIVVVVIVGFTMMWTPKF